jgi:hypothetical protein
MTENILRDEQLIFISKNGNNRAIRLPRERAAVNVTTKIKVALRLAGTSIGPNDTPMTGHAIADVSCW